jgi:hypothetical protein
VDLTTGWSITPTTLLVATFQQNFDENLKLYKPSTGSSGANDWNLFAHIDFYF